MEDKCKKCISGDLQNDCPNSGDCEGFLDGVDAGVEAGYELLEEILIKTATHGKCFKCGLVYSSDNQACPACHPQFQEGI